VAFTVRTDELLEQALQALTAQEGASRQEVVRQAVLERYARSVHRSRVQEGAEQTLERWADVLDRLGKA
jgi:hypothetical protein